MHSLLSRAFAAMMPNRKANVVDAAVPTINIINKSTVLSDADFQLMVEACNIQLSQHVAPMWLRGTWQIVANQPDTVGYPIVIMDNPDHAGALGYHTQTPNGKVWGRVFTKPVLNAKGTMLHGTMAVSTVLSHEIIEAYGDANVNLWADMMNGTMVAYELCDPVQGDSYEITTKNGTAVSVSNFVLPAWFDIQADLTAKYDFMAKTSKPFEMTKGGYMVTMNSRTGQVKNIFGSVEAEDLKNTRQDPHPAARTARKINNIKIVSPDTFVINGLRK